jgi:Cd2+/Zn2+-exporting ATPase
MIGRFAKAGSLAQVDWPKIAQTVVAALLIVAAVVAKHVLAAPEIVAIGLSAASLCLTGLPIVWGAVQGLWQRKTNVDELVSIAIVASVILGEWISAAVVAFIMVLGSLIEQFTSERARRQIEAMIAGRPETAFRIGEDGELRQVPIDELAPGDRILARPGDVIAADGTIEEGESAVDESVLTGEAAPADKASGDRVSAGTVNGAGSLRIRVERVGGESTQGKIAKLVQEAERHRAPILRVAENYARWFTPAILTLAAAVWIVTGDARRAVTMLIVGCPCAFVLATPTAVIAAMGRAARQGILIKGGKYLEACAKVSLLAFDKTGTLTTGRCRVREVIPLDGIDRTGLLFHAARLESGAEHPLAQAIVDEALRAGWQNDRAANIRREGGLGVAEITDAAAWRIGNRRFMDRHEIAISADTESRAARLREQGCTVLFVAEASSVRGLLAVEDLVREDARSVLDRLRAMRQGDIRILTGDAEAVARHVGEQLSVPPGAIHAGLLPDEKYRHLESLEAAGQRVCYVGDGSNDGPALAVASVGVSLGSSQNHVALETASVVLMRDGLTHLPFLLDLAKATSRTIRQNLLLFGLIFNATMLCLSGLGVLTPILGALGHNLGSVAVVLNSSRLLLYRSPNSD